MVGSPALSMHNFLPRIDGHEAANYGVPPKAPQHAARRSRVLISKVVCMSLTKPTMPVIEPDLNALLGVALLDDNIW